jgi:hypothetical protein
LSESKFCIAAFKDVTSLQEMCSWC